MGTADDQVEERRAAARDETIATLQEIDPPSGMIEMGRSFGIDPVDLLLRTTESSLAVYNNPPGPKSAAASARRLLAIYDALRVVAAVAPHDMDGALLKQSRAGEPPTPWLPTRPHQVAQVPPYTDAQVATWRDVVADFDNRMLANRRLPARKPPPPERRPDEQLIVVTSGKPRPGLPIPLLMYFGNWGKVITLIKTPEMSFKTKIGRIAIVAYILRAVGFVGQNGMLKDELELTKAGEITPEALAARMLDSDVVGVGGSTARVFFEADMGQLKLLDALQVGNPMSLMLDMHALNTIKFFTPIKEEFQAPKSAGKTGCASIEWMRELMPEVPWSYKAWWVVRKIEDDRTDIPSIGKPGDMVPMSAFMPPDDRDKTERMVVYLGGSGDAANELIIMTEDHRILAINPRNRDIQAFCTAIMSVAPFVSMFYMVAAAAGMVIAGEIAPALLSEVFGGVARLLAAPNMLTGAVRAVAVEGAIAEEAVTVSRIPRLVQVAESMASAGRWEQIFTAGTGVGMIALDAAHAGGPINYLKSLTSPWEAAMFLLNLLSIKGAINLSEIRQMMADSKMLGREAEALHNSLKSGAGEAGKLADDVATPGVKPSEAVIGKAIEDGARQLDRPPAGNTAALGEQRQIGDRHLDNRLGMAPPADAQKAFAERKALSDEPPATVAPLAANAVTDEGNAAKNAAKPAAEEQGATSPDKDIIDLDKVRGERLARKSGSSTGPAAEEGAGAAGREPVKAGDLGEADAKAAKPSEVQEESAVDEKAVEEEVAGEAADEDAQQKAAGDYEPAQMSGRRGGGTGSGEPGLVRPATGTTASRASNMAILTGNAGKGAAKVVSAAAKSAQRAILKSLMTMASEVSKLSWVGKSRESSSAFDAVKKFLSGDPLSEMSELAAHWPEKMAKANQAEIEALVLRQVRNRPQLYNAFKQAFAENTVGNEFLAKLPPDVAAELKEAGLVEETIGTMAKSDVNALKADVRTNWRNLFSQLTRKEFSAVKKLVKDRWNTIRKAFWTNVFDDKQLMAELEKMGVEFSKRGNAPTIRIGKTRFTITLDHLSRKAENPLEAFRLANLAPASPMENSGVKEALVRQLEELSGASADAMSAVPANRLPKNLAEGFDKVLRKFRNEEDVWTLTFEPDDAPKIDDYLTSLPPDEEP